MAKCDLCGETHDAITLASLLSIYQSAEVKDICRNCERWANAQIDQIRSQNTVEMRRRIQTRRDETQGPKPRSCWRKIFSRR